MTQRKKLWLALAAVICCFAIGVGLVATYDLRLAHSDASARALIPALTSLTNKDGGRVVQLALEWVQSR